MLLAKLDGRTIVHSGFSRTSLCDAEVSRPVQEIADFVSGIVIGTAVAMVFRLWAFKRFVFPHAEARPRPVSTGGGVG